MKATYWKVEIRDPYCGGWVPLTIQVTVRKMMSRDDQWIDVLSVHVINAENHIVQAKIEVDPVV